MKSIVFYLCLIPSLANAASVAGKGSASLIELYTSEGCSSCPPADRWLTGLKTRSGLWTEFVPLAFHVNYWDQLGWPDKFASPEYTQRQRAYSHRWGTSTIYTPGIVMQGKEAKISTSWRPTDATLEIQWANEKLVVNGNAGLSGNVHIAWLGGDEINPIKRGENAGKTLAHDFIVLKLQALGSYGPKKSFPLGLPAMSAAKIKALAVWVENDGVPVVATGGELR